VLQVTFHKQLAKIRRYRISEERSWRGSCGIDVIRLTPTASVWKGNNKPRKWHGYKIDTVHSDEFKKAVALAEADNAKLEGAS
jgi:hypothetical protein